MIKISKYAFVGAAMLTGSMAFTACSSDSDATDNGSAVNPTGETVKTQFAINVPKAGSTRMTGNTVQEGTGYTFRGITDIRLMPLTLTADVKNDTKLTKIIPLGDFGTDVYDKGNTENNLYSDVEIPVGTNHFLFYGVAGSNGETAKAKIGSLVTTLVDKNDDNKVNSDVTTANDITFKLENIASESTDLSTKDKLVGLLNDIAKAKDESDKEWSSVTEVDNKEYHDLYEKFTKLTSGSAHTILLTVQSLYNHVESSTEGMGKAIKDVIESKFTVKDDKSVEYKSDSNIDAIFPENLDLPQGAFKLRFTSEKLFSYVENNEGVITNPSLDINKLTYPASLYYFDNTALKATDNSSFKDWPSTAAEWAKPGNWDGWNDVVAATSRTIALKDNINYGVAMLVLTVKTKTQNLEDNAKGNDLTGNNKIVVPTDGFPVTGVLVGGQPTQSNWEFLPTLPEDGNYIKTVYDKNINGTVSAKYNSAVGTNYTLLLDNRKYKTGTLEASEDQNKVNIAVEFKNTSGVAFYGQNGIIEPEQKFYLLATLDPKQANENTANPVSFEGTGLSENTACVFIRDHKTFVNLTINKLSNAYNTIPDLRASNLQLGMSVDLKWENGLTFNVGLGD